MTGPILVYTNDLVKRFTVTAETREEAFEEARRLAQADIDAGNLDGWEMTGECSVQRCELD